MNTNNKKKTKSIYKNQIKKRKKSTRERTKCEKSTDKNSKKNKDDNIKHNLDMQNIKKKSTRRIPVYKQWKKMREIKKTIMGKGENMESFDEGSYEKKERTEGNNEDTETNSQINQILIQIKKLKKSKIGGK